MKQMNENDLNRIICNVKRKKLYKLMNHFEDLSELFLIFLKIFLPYAYGAIETWQFQLMMIKKILI